MTKPRKAVPLLDLSTGIAFIPITFQGNVAIAGDGNQYELSDCEPLKLEHFDIDRILIGDEGTEISVSRCLQGFMVSDDKRRFIVRLPDDVDIAAKSLAAFFNGEIVSDVPEKFRILEEVEF